MVELDLGPLLDASVALVRPAMEGRGIEIERRWPAADARPSDFGRFVPTSLGDGEILLH